MGSLEILGIGNGLFAPYLHGASNSSQATAVIRKAPGRTRNRIATYRQTGFKSGID
jgi:hypothetical protein